MARVCSNFNQRQVSQKTKTVSEQSFKMKCLSGNRLYPTLRVLVLFLAQFTPETTSLFSSNNTGPSSKINHRILRKVIKKPIFWPKNELFNVKNRLGNKYQEVRSQVSATFSETPNSRLTVSENFFVVAQLIVALFQF